MDAVRAGGAQKAVRPAFAAVLALICTVMLLHIVGIGIFTTGFLLQRVELVEKNACGGAKNAWAVPKPPERAADGDAEALRAWEAILDPMNEGECTLPPRFDKAVVWIIDALRYDFLAPATNDTMRDPYMHGHMQTPALRSASEPRNAFLAHFLADAPTTTLQRLKGLTTGSLPTFIEAGANFGGAGRVLEDNWISQFLHKIEAEPHRGMAFVGDDTWDTVFSDLFDANRSFPYSSFNVEDLDTVDLGVEEHMLREMVRKDARLVVAHSLGVDHVGHRFGASHPRMVPKLEQMNRLVDRVLELLDKDTLFILLGDHGMDATGDHGGDSELEVGAALWMYTKQPFGARGRGNLTAEPEVAAMLCDGFRPFSPLDGTHRSVPQIDLVPTVSLLLGTPIPFNNLGTVIPEVFAKSGALGDPDARLLRALRINARQVHTYLKAYAARSKDLHIFQDELDALWNVALEADAKFAALVHVWRKDSTALSGAATEALAAYAAYTRRAVEHARSVWAQFHYNKIAAGLFVLFGAVLATVWLWHIAAYESASAIWNAVRPMHYAPFGLVCILLPIPFSYLQRGVLGVAVAVLCGIAVGAWTLRAAPRKIRRSTLATLAAFTLLTLHAGIFASNSFTMWEDRISLGLFASVLLLRGLGSLAAPTKRLQVQMPLLALAILVLVRSIAMSRVCREEQAPTCVPSFYARVARPDGKFADNPAYAYAGPATNSMYVAGAAYAIAFFVPDVLRRILEQSQTYTDIAQALAMWIIRPALLAGAAFWIVDWAQGLERFDDEMRAWLLVTKTWVARLDLILIVVFGTLAWYFLPLCVRMQRQVVENKPKAAILGFGNAFGSAYLLLTTILFALLFLLAQSMGQLALSGAFLALVLLAELGDNERDAVLITESALQQPILPLMPSLLETSAIALLGFVAFFATGHQATLASIQWRVAFVGWTTVTYPWSPILVILNAFGPLSFLPAFAIVLLVLWNVAPTRPRQDTPPVPMHTAAALLRASMGFLFYHGVLALSAAIFACVFRRHLMLFKIWVPRFMMGGLGLLLADVAMLFGVLGAWRVAHKVHTVFAAQFY
ncbi:mannose-ethanolamine phosphotransferase gpi13 [Malassezia vespertilionis]|uniref:Gpi13p n=1 Tax=Malassezia vespertilionis TaxID=2020962 RepID=A0A2N1J8K0_9BASI|nr:mannose-ethanolamine phosphotransferase gpi13 [Malassezia vespertilionis]PKI82887.1 Gpi13p [Malassezia vespertilionis]WFD08275.1 mannose-ethanolamine phosphotransferase gpi13 [Malassezia vespertilionis]